MTLPKTFRGRDVNADYEKVINKYKTPEPPVSQPTQPQIADLNSKNDILLPRAFTGKGYDLEVSSQRLGYSSAVEKVGKELDIEYQNTREDSLGREFIGNNNWYNSLTLNLALGGKTLGIKEFMGLAKLLFQGMNDKIKVYDVSGKQIDKQICQKYFEDSFKIQEPSVSEWFDTFFKFEQGEMYVKSDHILDSNGRLTPKKIEVLDKNTPIDDGIISLKDYIRNPTSQGLPKKDVLKGKLYYDAPVKYSESSVAKMNIGSVMAQLTMNAYPGDKYNFIGTRFARII